MYISINKTKTLFLSQKLAITTFLSQKSMITRLSIAKLSKLSYATLFSGEQLQVLLKMHL